jgi:hypothetical protein
MVNDTLSESARGLAHSKTLRVTRGELEFRASVLECGGPPPLLFAPLRVIRVKAHSESVFIRG